MSKIIKINLILVLALFLQFSYTSGKSYVEDLTLTAEEKAKLDEFRELVTPRLTKEFMHRDVFLIRWLRAKYFNIYRAEKLLMDYLIFRENNRMDTIHEEDWSDMFQNYKYSIESTTRDGKPTVFANLGTWNLRQIVITGKQDRFLRYLDMILDKTWNTILEAGEKYQNVSQGMLLVNAAGFNLVQHGCLQCLPLILGSISKYDIHAPGTADKFIMVNAPGMAETAIRLGRTVLNPQTSKSWRVYGTNKRQWKQELLVDFTLDQLPIDLGGNKIYQYQKENEFDYDFKSK